MAGTFLARKKNMIEDHDPFATFAQLGVDIPEEDVPEDAAEGLFDPRISDEVQGLLYLGAIQQEVQLYGHTFVLRTLRAGEELEVGLLVKKYQDSISQARAYMIAVVAASLESIDGRPTSQPIGPNLGSHLTDRFNWISEHMYYPVVEALYEEYNELLTRMMNGLVELRGKS
jgi:hypothetical protein